MIVGTTGFVDVGGTVGGSDMGLPTVDLVAGAVVAGACVLTGCGARVGVSCGGLGCGTEPTPARPGPSTPDVDDGTGTGTARTPAAAHTAARDGKAAAAMRTTVAVAARGSTRPLSRVAHPANLPHRSSRRG